MLRTDDSVISVACITRPISYRHLSADLDNPPGRNLEKVCGIARGFGQTNEQPILPPRHARMCRHLERAPRQKERGRHDVEAPAVPARDRERLRHVRLLHVAELERDPAETG